VTPAVTVVTPVYNGADHLEPTLRSVREQTIDGVRHVVVDDGSTDATVDVVRRAAAADPRLVLVEQANQGLSAARNTGFDHVDADSEFVLFLDDDDVLRPRALELLAAALRSRPDAVAAHGGVAAIDGDGNPVPLVRGESAARRVVLRPERVWTSRRQVRELAPTEPSDFAAFSYVLFVYTVGQVLFRRAPLERLGHFDPALTVAQDLDMWLRAAAESPFAFVPEVVLDYRQAPGSLSSDQATTRREDLHARFKAITRRDVPPATRKLARDVHRQHEWHRAADRLDHGVDALRRRDVRVAARESVRASRSVAEALLAVPAWTWPFERRVEGFRRAASAP
jgi:GT2 family glycosyltransferase